MVDFIISNGIITDPPLGIRENRSLGLTFSGITSDNSITSGTNNTFIGVTSGSLNSSGSNNTFIGYQSGNANTISNDNTFIGHNSGLVSTGAQNTFIGSQSGLANTTGAANIFIGYLAGSQNTISSNKLYIANTNTTTPLIGGDFSTPGVTINKTPTPTSRLDINGSIALPVTATSIGLTLDITHFWIKGTSGVGGITITLPDATTCTGRVYMIQKVDVAATNITITPAGAQTINGAASKTIGTQWQTAEIISDGSNWVGNLLGAL